MPPARPRARARTCQRGPHLYRRGATWYARGGSTLPKDGVSLHTSERAVAEQRLAELLVRGPAGAVDEAPREVPLIEAVERFLAAPHGYTARTHRDLTNRLAAFGEWLVGEGISSASDITPTLIDRWLTQRSATVSRRTINRDLRAVRVCLRWCASRALIPRVGAVEDRKDLREPSRPQRREVPSPAEWVRILAALPHRRARAAIEALLVTGLRIEELRHLHVGSLRAEGDDRWTLRVEPEAGAAANAWTTKGYRTREIPLARAAAEAVQRYLGVALGPRGRPVTESWLLRKLHATCAALSLPRAGVHDTRRSFTTEAFRGGVPLSVLARWLGHADVRTTEGYLVAYRGDRQIVSPVSVVSTVPDGATHAQRACAR